MKQDEGRAARGLRMADSQGGSPISIPERDDAVLRPTPQRDRAKNPALAIHAGKGEPRTGVRGCRIIELPKIADPRGNLTFIEENHHLPFSFKRFFYLYDVPGGADRAGHALKTCHQFIVAMSGSFDVRLDDGRNRRRFHLNRSYYGLYIPPLVWREIDNFSSGSVCAVLASDRYREDDYFRDYKTFLDAVGGDGR
ncbi:MAG: TDP-4-oxo-6-deoxy-alpha-D-glucose-3,4-oxoisomerase [Syntrophaceae bacterium PtaU1.Bin231]|nr:MAG: TDP-4-oxo-6-deoxy-alpha-D-glucose-3,4-oxoisomerase [Syntrophaceae bacterium PtaU1.Bin231]